MASVTIELPSVLAAVLDGRRALPLEAGTLEQAWEAIRDGYPTLAVHVFDEAGNLRQHVLCFHNRVNTRWRAGADRALADGDVLMFLQAVSGG